MFNFLKNIGPTEIIIVAIVLVVIFGGKALLHRMARGSGHTVKELKKIKKEFNSAMSDESEPSKV